ncbi:MAG TPA: hypothetical protein VGS61_04970 [Acidimicrobiales bacterium]|nr:hypothetical protein [Acidimicrobiales bacterium]
MLENLPTTMLPRLLRRTVLATLCAGALGFIVALVLGSAGGAAGVVIGVGLAIFNLRVFDRQAARVELRGEQTTRAVRRQLGGKTAGRLVVLTALVVGALFLNAGLGVGIVVGLVIYQVVFILNVWRVIASSGGLS